MVRNVRSRKVAGSSAGLTRLISASRIWTGRTDAAHPGRQHHHDRAAARPDLALVKLAAVTDAVDFRIAVLDHFARIQLVANGIRQRADKRGNQVRP